MSISDIYASKMLEQVIKSYLLNGEAPTIDQITEAYNELVGDSDLNEPMFKDEDYSVAYNEESSASKFNNTNTAIKQDLDILLQAMYEAAQRATNLFTRWQIRADKIENRLIDLEARAQRLLSLTQDTAGLFAVVGDKFTNSNLIDLDNTTGLTLDFKQDLVTLSKNSATNTNVTRIFFNRLLASQARFNLVTSNSAIFRISNEMNTAPIYAFYDQNKFWKTQVYSTKRLPSLISELVLSLDSAVSLSSIRLQLHTSQSNSVTSITPFYSNDGISYSKLPANQTTLETLSSAEFIFPTVSARYFKFLLEKKGHDFVDGSGNYVYEFGAKEIGLYTESFGVGSENKGVLISKPLSITETDGSKLQFSRLTLETCEDVPSNTKIDYFLAVAREQNGEAYWLTSSGFTNNYMVGNVDTRLWAPISPINAIDNFNPVLLDYSSISKLRRTNIGLSYDRDGGDFVSPAAPFTFVTEDSALTGSDVLATNNAGVANRRYFMSRSSNKVLDIQMDTNIPLDKRSLTLWRNIGEKGIEPGDTTKQVRGVQIGWEFNAPYYSTVINIENSNGIALNVGNNPISIDGSSYTGIVPASVLSKGIHYIRVHKDYWKEVPPNLTTKAELKASDILYPYNQKLLIEGYVYGTGWTEEEVYSGADLFAGNLCEQVSIFDMIHNVAESDYAKFALDIDSPNTSTFDDPPNDATPLSYVFVVNVKNSVADFMNEKFMLEFNLTNELYSYVALRAELSTETSLTSPVLDEYRIKLGT